MMAGNGSGVWGGPGCGYMQQRSPESDSGCCGLSILFELSSLTHCLLCTNSHEFPPPAVHLLTSSSAEGEEPLAASQRGVCSPDVPGRRRIHLRVL